MTAETFATVVDNAAFAGARPALSVLTPFLRDDPRPLLAALDREAEALVGRVEVVLLDDGTGDPELAAAVAAAIEAASLPTRFISLAANQGRAKGRNLLAEQARSGFLLFLDSDMSPDQPSFLADWLNIAETDAPAVAFGGFSLKTASTDPKFAVHRAQAAARECLPAAARALHPEKHLFTSNLLIRRDVFEAEAFDAGFSGWGWEDVEWAMRVGRKHPVRHVENPATHMGLDTVEALARKYEQSVANFARVVERHPDIVSAYPSFRVARAIRRLPGRGLLRAACKQAALTNVLPSGVRSVALRLYRAALYAEVVG